MQAATSVSPAGALGQAATLISRVTDAGGQAAASLGVMGPGAKKAAQKRVEKLTKSAEFKTAVAAGDADAASQAIIKVLQKAVTENAEEHHSEIEEAIGQLDAALAEGTVDGLIGTRREEAQQIFKKQTDKVTKLVLSIKKNDQNKKKAESKLDTLIAARVADDFELDDDDAVNTKRAGEVKSLEGMVSALDRQKKSFENDLYSIFSLRLGGLTAAPKSCSDITGLPTDWQKTKAQFIKDPIKLYLLSNTCDYYAIIADAVLVMDSYCTVTSEYLEPPNNQNGYSRVPSIIRTEYKEQNKWLYRKILAVIGQEEMTNINQSR